jgi:exonuclease V
MLYKELFDAMISAASPAAGDVTSSNRSNVTMTFEGVFEHLGLSPNEPFSEAFLRQSRPIVTGNMLQFGTAEARCLADMVKVWSLYVEALGLGIPGKGVEGDGKSENHLELVYRRAGGRKKGKGKGKGKRKRQVITDTQPIVVEDSEDRELQLAIEMSLQSGSPTPATPSGEASSALPDRVSPAADEAVAFLRPVRSNAPMTEEEREKEEDAIALEIEESYRKTGEIQDAGEVVPVRASQDVLSPKKDAMDIDTSTGMLCHTGTV